MPRQNRSIKFGMLGENAEAGRHELLCRVLRACENNVPKAVHVLKTILAWRAEQGLPEILADENRTCAACNQRYSFASLVATHYPVDGSLSHCSNV